MDCEQAASPDPVDLLRDEGDARGLAVLTLQIESFEQKQGASHFCAAATAGGQRVGFLLELRPSALEPVPVAALELELPRCELLLKTTGEESDRFVAAVAAVYELELPVGHMPEVLEFEALCLAGDPARPQLGALQLMLVYTGGHPSRRVGEVAGFQWFLRIDVTRGELGFVDQASDSHAPIVAALSGGRPWRH